MLQQSLTCTSLEMLDTIAGQIIDSISGIKIVAFYGTLGAGKTTLIKAICKKSGVTDNVSSPTFSIVNEYCTVNDETIFHFDFYRIKNEEEAMDLGYEDYFNSGNLCLIEWPEKIPTLLPMPHAKILIVAENEIRQITIDA